jgi:hypothetical protein
MDTNSSVTISNNKVKQKMRSFHHIFLVPPITDTELQLVQEFTDSPAALRTAPVSRDGPSSRRKTIFGGS